MTIKKRLYVSNILMAVLPFVITYVTVMAFFVFINAILNGAPLELLKSVYASRTHDMPNRNALMIIASYVAFTCTVSVMFLTNRLLTKHLFRKIERPLLLLTDGARLIGEGGLKHRISYDGHDEFTPVCEAFNDMADRLNAFNEEAARNERGRKELLAGISHDLRSPLTSVKAFVEGLLDGVADTPEARVEYLQIIRQKTDEINSMVSQLFLYSTMDMGDYPTHPELLDAGKEITDFVSASLEDYRSKGLIIELLGAPSGFPIWADPVQLRSVFANILDNSAKYRSSDTARATVGCSRRGGAVTIVFEDDGPGVPDGALPMLFDVFYRGDPSRSDPRQGSGLGLAIAAKAVERMNGYISADNVKGGGLRIMIQIPEGEAAPVPEERPV